MVVWGGILERATTKEEFLAEVRQNLPRDYVLGLERLLFFCEHHFGREQTEYVGRSRSEFREPATLTEWVSSNLVEVYITH